MALNQKNVLISVFSVDFQVETPMKQYSAPINVIGRYLCAIFLLFSIRISRRASCLNGLLKNPSMPASRYSCLLPSVASAVRAIIKGLSSPYFSMITFRWFFQKMDWTILFEHSIAATNYLWNLFWQKVFHLAQF